MSRDTENAAPGGCGLLSWIMVAVYGFIGREIGAVCAYLGSESSGKPPSPGSTPHVDAIVAGREGMLPGALAAAIAGMIAIGLTQRACGKGSIAIGLAVAAAAGAIAGYCAGRF